jgi:hypothetical protein
MTMSKLKIFLIAVVVLGVMTTTANGQNNVATSNTPVVCNKMGAWLWYLKLTRFKDHASLADSLASLGVKRIYIKVANGEMDLEKWPEIIDDKVPAVYAERGIEAWAWSYNYPNNERNQANALYTAAKHGYKGFVIDIEAQYDGKPVAASKLFSSFEQAKKRAENENLIGINSFPIYCTTWGNPRAHRFPISTINQYVDAFMPQTYVENWGNEHMVTLEASIDEVNNEYKQMGCTKPIHHIVSTEKGVMTPEQVNRFLSYAGEETSVWPIPGTNTSMLLWGTWHNIDWDYDHCNTNRNDYVANLRPEVKVHAYPKKNEIHVEEPVASLQILNAAGHMVSEILNPVNVIDISHLVRGSYVMSVITGSGDKILKKFYKR